MARDEEWVNKIKSINFGRPNRKHMTKTTTDVHDHHKVDVTEHYDDRQDVNVKLDTLYFKGPEGRLEP